MSLIPQEPHSLLERTRNLTVMTEDELKRVAAEAVRDRDLEALWSLWYLTLTRLEQLKKAVAQ